MMRVEGPLSLEGKPAVFLMEQFGYIHKVASMLEIDFGAYRVEADDKL